MRVKLFDKNIKEIEHQLIVNKKAYSQAELNKELEKLKEKKLVAQDMSGFEFFRKLQNDLKLKTYSVESEKINKERYSIQLLNRYSLISTFEKKLFFPMSTALNIQGLSNFRSDFIFYSKELTTKSTNYDNNLTQKKIDNAFRKPYRFTKNIAKYKGSNIVYLTPKNTNMYEVIEYNDYMVSTINRAFVEMLINVQYFVSFDEVIECFEPIKDKMDIQKIYNIVEKFDFIYPYHQLVGFALNRLKFKESTLQIFKERVSEFRFYTEKNKNDYKFNKYWNIYYI